MGHKERESHKHNEPDWKKKGGEETSSSVSPTHLGFPFSFILSFPFPCENLNLNFRSTIWTTELNQLEPGRPRIFLVFCHFAVALDVLLLLLDVRSCWYWFCKSPFCLDCCLYLQIRLFFSCCSAFLICGWVCCFGLFTYFLSAAWANSFLEYRSLWFLIIEVCWYSSHMITRNY